MNDNADMKPPELPGKAPPLSRADAGGVAAGAAEAQPAAGVRPLQSLAVQVPLLLVIALSLAVATGAWGLRTIVLRSFERLEVANAELDLRRFANAVEHEVRLLGEQLTFAIDSGSDDRLLPDLLPLGPDLASASLPDLACIFDSQGALRSTDSDDRAGRLFHRVNPIDFCSQAEGDPAVARALAGERLAGLHELGATFFIIAVAPIPAASPLADAGAVLLLARHLSEEELEALAARMAVNVDFWSMATSDMDVLAAAAGAALSLGAPIIVNKRSDDVLQVYWAFQDASGEPAFLARANVFRDLRVIGDETVLLSALAMGGVGVATILLSLLLVRGLMVKRLTQLTQQLLGIRRGGLGGKRLALDRRALGRRDEIGVLAEEFDTLLGELSETTRQLADVSYRAGRAEVTEGSLHNIGNALNSLLASADAAAAKVAASDTARIAQAARELAGSANLTERQSKLAQYAVLAAEESAKRTEALKADIERAMLHIKRIEDILESQRRLGSDKDLAVATRLADLVESAVGGLPDVTAERIALRLDRSLAAQPPVVCVHAIVLQVLSNLLANATEAIARQGVTQGRIDISAETVDVDGVRMVDLRVADNGIGLDEGEPVAIFQRHYTTKSGRGHGIGLHWSANVVTSMGGQIYAESPGRGRGAALHLRLPVAPGRR